MIEKNLDLYLIWAICTLGLIISGFGVIIYDVLTSDFLTNLVIIGFIQVLIGIFSWTYLHNKWFYSSDDSSRMVLARGRNATFNEDDEK